MCVQQYLFPALVPNFNPELFTHNLSFSPPTEQKFYPLSTEPITKHHDFKKEERR